MKTEMRENTLNHYCGDHSKCHHPAHQGYQWKNRDIPEAQASLRRYLAEGSKIIRKVDPPSGSTQANESFRAVKGKYTNKRLNLMTSTEARFALGVISQLRNPGWQNELWSQQLEFDAWSTSSYSANSSLPFIIAKVRNIDACKKFCCEASFLVTTTQLSSPHLQKMTVQFKPSFKTLFQSRSFSADFQTSSTDQCPEWLTTVIGTVVLDRGAFRPVQSSWCLLE
jgi:hypothetical protein